MLGANGVDEDIKGIEGYAESAAALIPSWRLLSLNDKPRPILDLVPKQPCNVADIGAGIGVDAAGLAALGHRVVAIEPVEAFREAGRQIHASPAIEWVADGLPQLKSMRSRAGTFDLAMLSAVWMHLDEAERSSGMKSVAELIRPGGSALISLRHGPVPEGRRMFDVTAGETIALATGNGLEVVLKLSTDSVQPSNRGKGVTWTYIAFNKRE